MTQYTESPLTATLKSSGDFDSAWLVVRADSPVEMQSMLDALTTNGFGAVLAQADQAFKGSFQVGKGLGATPVEAPQNPAPQPQAQQAPPADANPWGVSAPPAQQTQAPTQDNPWGQSTPQQAAPQQAGNLGGGGDAPLVLGMPARRVSGVSKKTGKGWAAWADPRPKEATQHITEKTDDANDPRLAAGQAAYWAFIRD